MKVHPRRSWDVPLALELMTEEYPTAVAVTHALFSTIRQLEKSYN